MSQPIASTPVPASTPRPSKARGKALGAIALLVLLGGSGYAAYWHLALSTIESTDNAYVQGNVVQITSQVAGTVVAILADDADPVKAGQALVRLDPADAKVALDQAEAQLGQTVREVRTLYANNATFGAQIGLREAELARTVSEVQRAQDDVNRRAPLLASGAVGQEEYAHASAQLAASRSAQAAAQSALVAARESLLSNQSLTDGTSVAKHPGVQKAAARLRETYLVLRRAELPAPLDGVVARRSVQIGQRVAAGTPLMAVVALDKLWVDANFKEGQLKNLRLGQKATLTADVYGQSTTSTAVSAAWALAPALPLRCCRRRTPPATGSRWCSGCRCASRSTRRSWHRIRCGWVCRWRSMSTSATPAAKPWPMRRAASPWHRQKCLTCWFRLLMPRFRA